eukprot:1524536-Rhodomonas_salina.1
MSHEREIMVWSLATSSIVCSAKQRQTASGQKRPKRVQESEGMWGQRGATRSPRTLQPHALKLEET